MTSPTDGTCSELMSSTTPSALGGGSAPWENSRSCIFDPLASPTPRLSSRAARSSARYLRRFECRSPKPGPLVAVERFDRCIRKRPGRAVDRPFQPLLSLQPGLDVPVTRPSLWLADRVGALSYPIGRDSLHVTLPPDLIQPPLSAEVPSGAVRRKRAGQSRWCVAAGALRSRGQSLRLPPGAGREVPEFGAMATGTFRSPCRSRRYSARSGSSRRSSPP